MSNFYDEISQYAAEKAGRDLRISTEQYQQAVAAGNMDEASELLRHVRYHQQEVNELTPTIQPSAGELQWIRSRPSIMDNPKRLREVSDAYYQARNSGMAEQAALDLMSERYDTRNPEVPVLGSEDLIDIFAKADCFNNRDEIKKSYNEGYQKLMAAKSRGDYK